MDTGLFILFFYFQEQGWAVVQRTKTPREIREEYEALARFTFVQ